MEAEQAQPQKAGPGARVEIELESSGGVERLEVILVPDEQADFQAGFLGVGTPLGQAIAGRAAGDRVTYRHGDLCGLKILSVGPADAEPRQDASARRRERLRRAVEQARRTDAMIFASSFSGKWGDYDPQGIDHWGERPADDPDGPEAEDVRS